MCIRDRLSSTRQDVFTTGTDVGGDPRILVIKIPRLKKVPTSPQTPFTSAPINLLRNPESDTPLPDELVLDLCQRGVLDLPHDLRGLKIWPGKEGMWCIEGRDLLFDIVAGITVSVDR